MVFEVLFPFKVSRVYPIKILIVHEPRVFVSCDYTPLFSRYFVYLFFLSLILCVCSVYSPLMFLPVVIGFTLFYPFSSIILVLFLCVISCSVIDTFMFFIPVFKTSELGQFLGGQCIFMLDIVCSHYFCVLLVSPPKVSQVISIRVSRWILVKIELLFFLHIGQPILYCYFVLCIGVPG